MPLSTSSKFSQPAVAGSLPVYRLLGDVLLDFEGLQRLCVVQRHVLRSAVRLDNVELRPPRVLVAVDQSQVVADSPAQVLQHRAALLHQVHIPLVVQPEVLTTAHFTSVSCRAAARARWPPGSPPA